ncbi:MAG: hypothetical protein AAF197_05105 [Pseudomonadota bacterium]
MKLLVDTHVHCYRHDDLPALLNHAADNMRNSKDEEDFARVLFFTNSRLDNCWDYISKLATSSTAIADWQFGYQDDFIIAAHLQLGDIYLASARQVNTKERLELLLLGIEDKVDDDLPAEHYINSYFHKALVVCPWGVGKWLGQRAVVLKQLQARMSDKFSLGDNGGRPSIWSWVPHFNEAKKQAKKILNGSDPLPIEGELDRVGSFGVELEIQSPLSLENVLAELRNGQTANFGSTMPLLAFLKKRYLLSTATTANPAFDTTV